MYLYIYIYNHASFISASNRTKKDDDTMAMGSGYIVVEHASSIHELD